LKEREADAPRGELMGLAFAQFKWPLSVIGSPSWFYSGVFLNISAFAVDYHSLQLGIFIDISGAGK
jgi:hypothetical protein